MQDPSCLLSRVLFEISSTVCIQVSPTELADFGVVYNPSEGKEDEEMRADDAKGPKKKSRRRCRRQKLKFKVKETNDNQVLCKNMATITYDLVKYGEQQRFRGWMSNWNLMNRVTVKGDAFLLGGKRLSECCMRTKQRDTMKMEFISIVLPSSAEEVHISPMKNMQFEMMQTDTMLLHAVMGNGETIMFIRNDAVSRNIDVRGGDRV